VHPRRRAFTAAVPSALVVRMAGMSASFAGAVAPHTGTVSSTRATTTTAASTPARRWRSLAPRAPTSPAGASTSTTAAAAAVPRMAGPRCATAPSGRGQRLRRTIAVPRTASGTGHPAASRWWTPPAWSSSEPPRSDEALSPLEDESWRHRRSAPTNCGSGPPGWRSPPGAIRPPGPARWPGIVKQLGINPETLRRQQPAPASTHSHARSHCRARPSGPGPFQRDGRDGTAVGPRAQRRGRQLRASSTGRPRNSAVNKGRHR
jgi:hypothetical protein